MPTAAPHNISLADLHAAGLRLRPVEAVTIARELTLRAHRGELPGIPSSTVLRFTNEGDTLCEGPVAAGQSVERAGRLLESLLPGFDAPPEFRVPGALRLVVARSLGTLDLPAYSTLDEFADAMARFGADDMRTVVGGFVRTWRAAVESADVPADGATETEVVTESLELTISDVRRARRATGLRLADIAQRSRIPISLLRELEWGYFINWPANQDGRSQLVRYARAAGLDVEVVMRAVWPVLEQAVRTREGAPAVVEGAIVEDEPAVPAADTRLVRRQPDRSLETRKKLERRPLWLAALAIPALLAIGFIPAAWQARINDAGAAPASSAAAAPPASTPRPTEGSSPSGPAGPGAPSVQTQGGAPKSDASAPSSMTTTTTAPGQSPPAQVLGNVAGARVPVVASQRVSSTEPGPSPDRADLPDAADLPDEHVAFSPTFASVGSAMFYHADAGDSSALMRADTDSSGAVLRVTRIVDDSAKNFHVRPSPDGARIAFDSDREGERAVYIADANGKNVRRISGPGFAAVPSWSPDGRTLAFVRAEPRRPRVWNLWTSDLESGDTRRLTNHRVGQPWGASWFPDGRRIAYSHEARLIIRSIDSGEERVFNTPKAGHLVRTPAVSPDGSKVMFQVHKDGAWLLDVANGAMRKVLADPTAEEFTWSSDGRRVAYHSRKAGGWGVWMMTSR